MYANSRAESDVCVVRYRVTQKIYSILYVVISSNIHVMCMIYIAFERGGPKFSNTTSRALA